jgi:hypothetical protein
MMCLLVFKCTFLWTKGLTLLYHDYWMTCLITKSLLFPVVQNHILIASLFYFNYDDTCKLMRCIILIVLVLGLYVYFLLPCTFQ